MESATLFNASMALYLAASVAYIAYIAFRGEKVGLAATVVTATGFVLQTAALGLRWYESYDPNSPTGGAGHIPLSNMYESMVFWSWSIVLIYLVFERIYRNRALGAVVAPLGFLAIAAISIAPNISQEIEPLVPALQSNWLTVHVITSFLGYAGFTISFVVSVLYLMFAAERRGDPTGIVGTACFVAVVSMLVATILDFLAQMVSGAPQPHLFGASLASPNTAVQVVSWVGAVFLFALVWYAVSANRAKVAALFPTLRVLDDISYKTVMVGFPLLTLGIVTGAAWANYAWGTYWSWDPKETWSLITWLIYAAFLHARFTAGWRGKKTAILSVIGFAAVVFTYIGVNFVLSGLHSYA